MEYGNVTISIGAAHVSPKAAVINVIGVVQGLSLSVPHIERT
ncbi:hypothetical protein NU09_1500 [Flavobacterium beibuense]|uniref:Uncharacterized protein n=1 Tax=Flavobacterium beibuense TaxID=657326 RepID=A0A444WDY9_9FLAO|nr:hypothetical protein NU09_1500 [Flavobacterium beibuense]